MSNDLADLDLLQAYRLGHPAFKQALKYDQIDPFPHGGEKGAVSTEKFGEETLLATKTLRSFDSGLPDYILEEILSSYLDEDFGLYDFLGIFDRCLQLADMRVSAESTIFSEKDATRKSPLFTKRLQRILGQRSRLDALQLIPVMLGRSRNIETLKRIVTWWVNRPVEIISIFSIPRGIDPRAITRIGSSKFGNSCLGKGAILGRYGFTAQGRLELELKCKNLKDFRDLQNDNYLLNGLEWLITHFLRDPIPFSVFAILNSDEVPLPRLKAQTFSGTRLGQYHCLKSNNAKSEWTRIKIMAH